MKIKYLVILLGVLISSSFAACVRTNNDCHQELQEAEKEFTRMELGTIRVDTNFLRLIEQGGVRYPEGFADKMRREISGHLIFLHALSPKMNAITNEHLQALCELKRDWAQLGFKAEPNSSELYAGRYLISISPDIDDQMLMQQKIYGGHGCVIGGEGATNPPQVLKESVR